ncbi:hypothetical protein P171DRAFT_482129 [Karstenula rhodostoma CBS 690.94]|uniref:Uncharacterized protein n=1 Tax=Karstenula rhodostoma CBS 690.94 TaxID=1392251 RepID=A0A9P4UFL6_9PLEO|nr:hypothetical protein P171DRAFT_482129 [Karstenula rhodostoma CBS 690.94]
MISMFTGVPEKSQIQRHVPHPVSHNKTMVRRNHEDTDQHVDGEEEEEKGEEEEEEVEEVDEEWTPPSLHNAPGKFRLGRTYRMVSSAYIRKAFGVTITEADEASIHSYLKPGQKNKQYSLYHLWSYAIHVKGMSQDEADAVVDSEKNRKAASSARYKSYLSGDYAQGGDDFMNYMGF